MINYKVESNTSPVIHEVKYPISKKEVQRIRILLDINFEEWDDAKLEQFGIVKDSSEGVIGVAFNDGATLDWTLRCGTHNYYDDVLFTRPDGKEETFDCTYELDDIEIDADSDVYIVRLDIQDE